ncbi:MAG: hypothetical protein ACI9SK_000308 [Zhongshania sp.]|jgi:hypothetical protein
MEAVVCCGSKFKTATDYKTNRRKKTASQLVTDLPFSSMEAGQDSDLGPWGKAVLLFKSRSGRKVTSRSCYSLIIPKAFMRRYGGFNDNAVAEYFLLLLQKDRVKHKIYKTRDNGRA